LEAEIAFGVTPAVYAFAGFLMAVGTLAAGGVQKLF
jgi:hypothetical protein